MDDSSRFGWDEDPETKLWEDWPRCPRCGTRRDTACPDCGVPGVDFALAELDPAADLPLPSGDTVDGASLCQPGGGSCGGAHRHSARAAAEQACRDVEAPSAETAAADGGSVPAEDEPAVSTSPASPEGLAVMLVCPICDEAFPPRFFRRCRHCGHDFGSGRELESSEEPVANYRVVLTILAVLAVMAGISLYMFLLFR